jgi:hypothetical protein
MLKTLITAVLLGVAGAALAQTTPSQTPAVTPSQSPAITPSQTPAVTPSETPAVTPSQGPTIAPSVSPSPVTPPGTVGGLSRCENMIGLERDSCMQQQQRAGTGSTGPATGTSGTNTQPTAPIGSPTGTVR